MDRLNLKAQERKILGKKVKALRSDGLIPGHVFGKGLETEHVSVSAVDFHKVLTSAGETGLVDLIIDKEKVRPVLIRGVQYDPVEGLPLNIDFYQVNLKEKVTVPVPLILIGEEPESVKLGENIVLQTLNQVEVEALPTDLVEKIEVDITALKNVDDAIMVSQLNYDHDKLTVLAEPEEIVVKIAPAVTAEMEKLMEEQAAEAAAATEVVEGAEGEVKEGEEAVEGGEEVAVEAGEAPKEETKEPPKE